MILAIERVAYSPDLYLQLCEVSSEEEAFAEMRRFLYVNHIFSNITSVELVEGEERWCKFVPRHKEVMMIADEEYENDDEDDDDDDYGDKRHGAIFHIYYGSDRPRREKLGSLDEWALQEEIDSKTGKTHLVLDVEKWRGAKTETKKAKTISGEWYNYIKRYLRDLEWRRAGVIL